MGETGGDYGQLLSIVRQVRRRWRLRQVLQGAAALGAALLILLWVSGIGLEQARFSAGAVIAFRVIAVLALGALVVRSIVLPLFRSVTDEQVALYIEEHAPELGESLLTAVTQKTTSVPDGSESLRAGLVRQAVRRARAAGGGRGIETPQIRRATGILTVAAVGALATLLFGPTYLRHGASALFFPAVSADAANPYSIDVLPGDLTISRGSDQVIEARLNGFASDDVTLFRRSGENGAFEPFPMIPGDSAGFEALLYAIEAPTEYFVESTGVRSATYTIDVADLPYVDNLELVYHFPAYTGLPPRTVPEGGDIAVLRGTRIEVRALPTMPTPLGAVVFQDSTQVELAPGPEGTLTGDFPVNGPGTYGITLTTDQGLTVPGSPQYAIDVLTDQPPSVTVSKPGRDTQASSIEEVYVEVEGRDDYGVGRLEIIYSVNGGEEVTQRVFSTGRATREASAGHTFFLEEFELEPGDVVAYYARATDNNAIGGRKSVESDMYFLSIRSFEKEFSQAASMGGGGGGGGAAMDDGLVQQQREVIAATFNVNRDRERYDAEEYSENVVTVSLAQSRLVDQVENLVDQIEQRGVARMDPAFETVMEELPKAVEQMRIAVDSLQAEKPKAALPSEQRALQHLMRAEEAYRNVEIAQQNGGGGGGGGGAAAEDLADLFQLELDKMQNQYETVQRNQQQQQQAQADEALERLKELARRQEQAAERQRRRAQSGNAQGGGEAQRELAAETEEAARQLERLARENRSEQLAQTAEQLREAAQAMRESAGSRGNASAAQARQALERLRDARRLMEREQAARPGRAADDAAQRAADLAEDQREVTREVQNMPVAGDRAERTGRVIDRKNTMEQELAQLESDLDRAAREASQDEAQREAARGLREAADWIRDSKLKEKVRYTRAVMQNRPDQTTRPLEEEIETDLQRLRELTEAAAGAVQETAPDEVSEAMDRTRDLVRGLESMEERLGERAEEARRLGRRAGQEGQPQGESGESGESGEQAQGQAGQEGGEQGSQGQAGQAGSQQGGQAGGQQQAGGQNGGSAARGGLANGRASGVGANLTDDEIRQMRREFRERTADARALREQLSQMGEDTAELDELIGGLRALDNNRVYNDIQEIQRLQAALLEVAKRFEFSFRRRVEGDSDELLLQGSEEIPAGFEKAVEEYYRALARGGRNR